MDQNINSFALLCWTRCTFQFGVKSTLILHLILVSFAPRLCCPPEGKLFLSYEKMEEQITDERVDSNVKVLLFISPYLDRVNLIPS